MEDYLIDITETAALVKRSPATIRWWIHTGQQLGPLFQRVGRRRMAKRSAVLAWLDSKFVEAAA